VPGTTRRQKCAKRSTRQDGQPASGSALSWSVADGVIELALHRAPCNELGSVAGRTRAVCNGSGRMQAEAHALIIYSEMKPGFCAGADLRELYQRSQAMDKAKRSGRSAIFWSEFTAC
jgi:enoyl-CoA hydratase/carnithine racemase